MKGKRKRPATVKQLTYRESKAKPNVRQWLNNASALANDIIEVLRPKTRGGQLLNEDELRNLKAAQDILVATRKLNLEQKRLDKDLPAATNVTNNHLITAASTDELMKLLEKSKDGGVR